MHGEGRKSASRVRRIVGLPWLLASGVAACGPSPEAPPGLESIGCYVAEYDCMAASERYPSGRRKGQGAYYGNDKTGLWMYWYESGVLESLGVYEQGKPHGLWVRWSESGEPAEAAQFYLGEKNGAWMSFEGEGEASARSGLFKEGERVRDLTAEELAFLERSVAAEHEVHGRRR